MLLPDFKWLLSIHGVATEHWPLLLLLTISKRIFEGCLIGLENCLDGMIPKRILLKP
jgi:hypothetical protein